MSTKAKQLLVDAMKDGAASDQLVSMIGKATSVTATENTLEPGKIYKGRIAELDFGLRTMLVSVGLQQVPGCIFAAGELASFFGLGEYGMPMIGAEVSLLYGGAGAASIVLGTTGTMHPAVKAGRSSLTGYTQKNRAGQEKAFKRSEERKPSNTRKGNLPPIDLLPGEMMKTSGLGPAIKLLYNFASLSASDCAKVEACILNDMVRIVDNYFVHHTCGGDELIWTAGDRCTGEEHFSSMLFEAEGKKTKEEELAKSPVAEFNYDIKESVDKPFSDTGRWRLSRYWGFLGDMVHKWVTTPTEVTSNIMEGAFRTGQYRSWIGSDGTLCIQSAGGVQIEVTQNIVIPAILKAWNQPDFDMEKAMEDLDSELLKVWGSGPKWKDLTVAVWQLRYYSKYIALWHSLDRFRQLEKKEYCKIPKEKDDEVKPRTPAAEYEDRSACDQEVEEPREHHALLSMDMGGNVALTSQGNTSVILSNGSIQASCPGNIELKAGGTVSIQGKNVSILGGQTVEIMSIFGRLTLKARTLFQALCEAGVLWLKGDAKKDKEVPENPLEGEEPVFSEYSVVIDAPEGKTLVHGAEGVTVGSTEEDADIVIQARGPESDVHLVASKDISFLAYSGTILAECMNWICGALEVGIYGSRVIKLGAQVAVQKGILHVQRMHAQLVAAYGSFKGRSRYVTEEEDLEPYKPDTTTEDLDAVQREAEKEADKVNYGQDYQSTEFGEGKACSVFKFPEWDEEFDKEADETLSLKRSPYEEESEASKYKDKYTKVLQFETKTLEGKRTEQSVPFPGQTVKRFEFSDKLEERLLGEPWKETFSSGDIKTLGDMTPKEYTYVFYKNKK